MRRQDCQWCQRFNWKHLCNGTTWINEFDHWGNMLNIFRRKYIPCGVSLPQNSPTSNLPNDKLAKINEMEVRDLQKLDASESLKLIILMEQNMKEDETPSKPKLNGNWSNEWGTTHVMPMFYFFEIQHTQYYGVWEAKLRPALYLP